MEKKVGDFEGIIDPIQYEDKIVRTVKIQHDGKQFSVRIPAEIARYMKIKKGDKFTFELHLQKDSNHKIYFKLDK